MRIDELRRALDDLAGDAPAVDDVYVAVTSRTSRDRRRVRIGALALAACVVAAAAAVGVTRRGSDTSQVTVRNPVAAPGSVADFAWTRATPPFDVHRIVTANGTTFAVGTAADGTAAIGRLDAKGGWTTIDPAASYDRGRPGSVSDLVQTSDALVAVGRSIGTTGSPYTDAWRSTDGGRSWQDARIETAGALPSAMDRVLVSGDVVYAIGSRQTGPDLGVYCPISIWTSRDGADFHLTPAQFECSGAVDAAAGPAGVVVTTADNATAWHAAGSEWSPRSISHEQGAPVAIAADDDGYVAVGSISDGNDIAAVIWWSADGRSWERVATDTSPADPGYRQAQFTGVAHSAAGWIAVGMRARPGTSLLETDAIVWTSLDGRHWSPDTRDGDVFEQFARADGVGATANGFAIIGKANLTGPDTPVQGDPNAGRALWLGSATPLSAQTGILEGSLREVGGPPPGLDRGVRGMITIRAPDGRSIEVRTNAFGRYSQELAPGRYTAVGHSPVYGSGTYDCVAWAAGSDMGGDPIDIEPGRVAHFDFICSLR